MLKSLLFQRQDLQKQLDDINALIVKCKGGIPNHDNVVGMPKRTRSTSDNQIGERMMEILSASDMYLTSRQILEAIKNRYEDVRGLDKVSERKYMANLSARLTKGFSDGDIDKNKIEGKDATYGIKKEQFLAAP